MNFHRVQVLLLIVLVASGCGSSGHAGAPESPGSPGSPAVPPAARAPGAVSNLNLAAGIESISGQWSPPSDDGGAAITGYRVTLLPSGTHLDVTDPQVRFDHLSSRTAYSIQVVANNSAGAGPATVSSTVTPTPGPAQVAMVQTAATASGCVKVQYQLLQLDSLPADVTVEFDTSGTGQFRRATQAGSTDVEGLLHRSTNSAGVAHAFLWDSTTDLPRYSGPVTLKVSAQAAGQVTSQQTTLTIDDGLSFVDSTTASEPAFAGVSSLVSADLNRDGVADLLALDAFGGLHVALGVRDGSFQVQAPVSIAAGGGLWIADLNRDAKSDFVAVLADGSGLVLGLGDGAGGFTRTTIAVSGAKSAAVADFDRDGKPDLVVLTADSIVVLPGDGAGGFGAAISTSLATEAPSWLGVRDLDRDGNDDLLVLGGGKLAAFLGHGDGTFAAGPVTPVDGARAAWMPESSDLVVAGNAASVLASNHDGSFAVAQTASLPSPALGLAVADPDADGIPDVLVGTSQGLIHLRATSSGLLTQETVASGEGAVGELAVADLDRDGRPDVAASAAGGLATFAAHWAPACELRMNVPFEFGLDSGRSGVAGDVDGDGKPDVLINASGGIQVLLGLGDGQFRTGPFLPVGAGATLADVNADGQLDLLTIDGSGTSFDVSLSQPDGGFALAQSIGIDANAPKPLTVDFDHDGHLDLVIPTYSGNIDTYRGLADGGFERTQTISASGSSSAVTGDFNGDGLGDIAVGDNTPVLRLFASNGDGTWRDGGVITAPGNVYDLFAADLDGDGRPDLVGTRFWALHNEGDGGFLAEPEPGSPITMSYDGVWDFDSDGRPEFVTSDGASIATFVADGGGLQTLEVQTLNEASPQALFLPMPATADFLGTGHSDLIAYTWLNPSSPNRGPLVLQVLPGDGHGGFDVPPFEALGDTYVAFGAADLNDDGIDDLVAVTSAGDLQVRFGNGAGDFSAPQTLDTLTLSAYPNATFLFGDFDRNGHQDIALFLWQSNVITVYLQNADGSFGKGISKDVGASLDPIAVADFNRDGVPDLLVTNSFQTATVNLALGNGDGTFGTPTVIFTGATNGFIDCMTADLNRDGSPDIVVAAGKQLSVLLNNGDGTFTAQPSQTAGELISVINVGDLNGDAIPDVVGETSTPRQILTWLGTGDGSLVPSGAFPLTDRTTLELVDLNLDGKLDLWGSTLTGGSWVLLGNGDGTFTAGPSFAGAAYQWLIAGRFHRDRRPDRFMTADMKTFRLVSPR